VGNGNANGEAHIGMANAARRQLLAADDQHIVRRSMSTMDHLIDAGCRSMFSRSQQLLTILFCRQSGFPRPGKTPRSVRKK